MTTPEELQSKLAAAEKRVKELAKALEFIEKHGGRQSLTEYGSIGHPGGWCAEQARSALRSAKAKEQGK